MIQKILWNDIAAEEFAESFLWYEEQKPGLGYQFESAVELTIQQITSQPDFYPKKKANYRTAKTSRFPFTIVYIHYLKENLIFISSIYHQKRNPRKKFRRR